MSMNPSQLVIHLNALNVGEIASIRGKLEQALQACVDLDQADLVSKLTEARQALELADMKTYRKRVETVIARLGHIK